MKSSASESKPFQSRSKGEIPCRARRKERLSRSKLKQVFLTDSDAEKRTREIKSAYFVTTYFIRKYSLPYQVTLAIRRPTCIYFRYQSKNTSFEIFILFGISIRHCKMPTDLNCERN